MPIRIRICAEYDLSDMWASKEDWMEAYEGNPAGYHEFFAEDWFALLEDGGGLAKMLTAKWVEEA